MKRCRVVRGDVRPCDALHAATEYELRAGKGLRFTQLTNVRTLKKSRNFYHLKSGAHKKRGVILNFCPFCGANISKHLHDDKEKT